MKRGQLVGHGIMCGQTQSGKSTLAMKWLSAQEGVKIFVNTKRQKEWRAYCKHIIRNPEDMTHIYENYPKYSTSKNFFLIEPDVTSKEAIDRIAKIFDITLKYHQDHPYKFKTNIFIDEIQVFQSKFTRDESLARLWTMGLGLGIKAVAISQRPQLINNDILYNSDDIVLLKLTDSDMKYLDERGIIDYDPEKHIFDKKYKAYRQTNKSKGLKELKNAK